LGLVALCGEIFDLSDNGLAVDDFAEDDVFAVEMGGWDGCNEELGAVSTCKVKILVWDVGAGAM
jgi:hypothetical protein